MPLSTSPPPPPPPPPPPNPNPLFGEETSRGETSGWDETTRGETEKIDLGRNNPENEPEPLVVGGALILTLIVFGVVVFRRTTYWKRSRTTGLVTAFTR